MRYRLMASYLGASYQAAVGPSDRDVTLFAAPPPPEEHGFSPAPGGIWRKQVRLSDIDGLWESRPIGSYHGEPCLVLDDLGDRLHIAYLGMDERRAGQLGYWQVDRGVFEVVVPRQEITDLAEERHEFPIALLLSSLPRALNAGEGAHLAGGPGGGPAAGRPAGVAPAGGVPVGSLPAGGPPARGGQQPQLAGAQPQLAGAQPQLPGHQLPGHQPHTGTQFAGVQQHSGAQLAGGQQQHGGAQPSPAALPQPAADCPADWGRRQAAWRKCRGECSRRLAGCPCRLPG